jgi:hypothetical protein
MSLYTGLICPRSEPIPFGADVKVADLIRRLGDADFKVREAASAALLKYGEAARGQLQQAIREVNDPEIRRRAQHILDALDQERRLAAGVHVIGLYEPGSPSFRLVASWGKDTDWPRFCADLVEQGKKDAPSPGKRIWELLPQETRDVVTDKDMVSRIQALIDRKGGNDSIDKQLMRAWNKLTRGLEEALRRPDFYQEKAFAGIALDEEGKLLLKRYKQLSTLETWVLNRRLLEASFPQAVRRANFHLDVPVRVVRTKEPITLVLCSYESVRWVIQAEEGAKIERVIVGGYYLQEVTGTNAPVTYRVYEMRGPAQVESYFFAYQRDHEQYPRMVEAVRALTGKEITTFQGRYRYEGGPPFVVGVKP